MKLNQLLFILFISVLILAGCSTNSSNETDASESSESKVLKFGHVNGEGHPAHLAALELAETIEEETDGRYTIDVNANSTLGGEPDLIEGVTMGSIDIAYTAATPLANYVDELFVADLPFLIKDAEHAEKVFQGEIGDELLAAIEEKTGAHAMTFVDIGFRKIGLVESDIETVDDLSGIKIRTMENPLHLELWESLGASPTPMAFGEAFTAFQQGAIDAMEMTNTHFIANGVIDIMKYYVDTNHVYTPGVVLLSDTVWSELSEEDKAIFTDAFNKYAEDNNRLNAELETESYDQIVEAGVDITELDREELLEKTEVVYENHPELMEMADRIKAIE